MSERGISRTFEHIAGITRKERQKDRPADSRGRRVGRRPEEERARTPREGVKGRKEAMRFWQFCGDGWGGGGRRRRPSRAGQHNTVARGAREGSALIKPGSM